MHKWILDINTSIFQSSFPYKYLSYLDFRYTTDFLLYKYLSYEGFWYISIDLVETLSIGKHILIFQNSLPYKCRSCIDSRSTMDFLVSRYWSYGESSSMNVDLVETPCTQMDPQIDLPEFCAIQIPILHGLSVHSRSFGVQTSIIRRLLVYKYRSSGDSWCTNESLI